MSARNNLYSLITIDTVVDQGNQVALADGQNPSHSIAHPFLKPPNELLFRILKLDPITQNYVDRVGQVGQRKLPSTGAVSMSLTCKAFAQLFVVAL